MKKGNLVSTLALVLSLVAITMCTLCCLSKEKKIAEVLSKNPELVIDALQNYEKVAMEKQLKALEDSIKNNADVLYNDASSPFIGDKNSKAVLVVFYDYSCGYCHRLYPTIKELSDRNPDAKFVFKPLMFLGPISEYAAKAVMAANLQGKFAELNDALFGYEGQLTEEKIDELAGKVGVNVEKYKADLNSENVGAVLTENSVLASALQVQGVPTVILGNKVVQSFEPRDLQSAIDALK
ncbi:MAG: DsbA family protein [Lactobacillaceae bacterium]|jgi:protein-disulfide isomerase|nr:DsbA family protein [Lactobacillaceae bacterium]